MNHSDYTRHTCTICTRTFKDNWHLQRHIKTHNRSPSVQCDKCDKVFNNLFTLNRHQKGKKCKGNPDYEGLKSEDDFAGSFAVEVPRSRSETDIVEWFETVLLPDTPAPPPATIESYFCRICGEVMHKDNLGKHIVGHHADLYQTIPEDSVKLTITRTYAYAATKPSANCRMCAQDAKVLDKVKKALKAVSEGHTADVKI